MEPVDVHLNVPLKKDCTDIPPADLAWGDDFPGQVKRVFVVDTNFALHLTDDMNSLVAELERRNKAQGSPKTCICLPYVVHKKEINPNKSADVVDWMIDRNFCSQGVVQLEGSWSSAPIGVVDFLIVDKDCSVLRCCKYLQHSNIDVLLLTGDKLLHRLAKIEKIPCFLTSQTNKFTIEGAIAMIDQPKSGELINGFFFLV